MTVRLLVTGFEPFGGASTNPSADLVARLDTATAVLPVELQPLPELVAGLLARHRPTHVLCLGLSSRAGGLLVERVGLNLVDARIPDNAGVQPVDEPVVPGGPAAYLVSLPVKAMLAGIREAQVPAELSLSAGTYVCNALLYQVLHQAHQLPPDQRPRCGFIHLPPAATVSLDRQERGLRAALARVDSAEPGLPGGFLD